MKKYRFLFLLLLLTECWSWIDLLEFMSLTVLTVTEHSNNTVGCSCIASSTQYYSFSLNAMWIILRKLKKIVYIQYIYAFIKYQHEIDTTADLIRNSYSCIDLIQHSRMKKIFMENCFSCLRMVFPASILKLLLLMAYLLGSVQHYCSAHTVIHPGSMTLSLERRCDWVTSTCPWLSWIRFYCSFIVETGKVPHASCCSWLAI